MGPKFKNWGERAIVLEGALENLFLITCATFSVFDNFFPVALEAKRARESEKTH
jgi:hypothetical protein